MTKTALPSALAPTTVIHAENAGDEPLLRLLFAEARANELEALPNDDARALFLSQQFSFWERHLSRDFPAAERLVITDDADTRVGRLVLDVTSESIHIVDIAIVTAAQRRGHGSAVMLALQARANASELPITLTVARGNEPARAFYSRFGLIDVTQPGMDAGTHRALRSAAAAASAAEPSPPLPEHAEFVTVVGSTFAAVDERGAAGPLTLTACSPLRRPAAGSVSYTLTFRGQGPSGEQGIFTLAHTRLGASELFLVPRVSDANAVEYTANINTLEA